MQTIHGSYESFSEITKTGLFEGIFTGDWATAHSHGGVLHTVTSPRPLTDYALNYEIEGAYEIAVDVAGDDADAIMDPNCPCDIYEDGGEAAWELQRLRGKLAARLGYTSVEMRDEHGQTWLCLPGCEIRPYQSGDDID